MIIVVSETVTESFGQLVVQSILLFRFSWLVQKDDFSNFGISFLMYVSFSMSVSFVTMVLSIIKYHNRNRESLRPMFSMGTILLTMMWINDDQNSHVLDRSHLHRTNFCFHGGPG